MGPEPPLGGPNRGRGFKDRGGISTRRNRIVIGIVSALLIIAMVLAANPSQMGEHLAKADYFLISIVVLLYFVNIPFKAGRWYILLRAAKLDVPFPNCITYFCIGQAFNNAFPGRVAGEATRVYALHSQEKVNAGAGLATIVSERLMDLVMITLIATTGLVLLFPQLVDEVRVPLAIGVAIAIGIDATIILFLSRRGWIHKAGGWLAKVSKRVLPDHVGVRVSNGILTSTHSFNTSLGTWGAGSWGYILVAISITVVIWANEITRLYLIMLALGASPTILAVMIAASFATLSTVLLAAGSGNIVIVSTVFTASGVSFATATTAGILSAMTSIWLSIPIGVLAMLVAMRHARIRKD